MIHCYIMFKQPPTLEEICGHVQVSLKALDEECTDEGQDILADYCGPWKRVARKLFTSDTVESVIIEIEDDNIKAADQKSGFIRRWVKELGHKATYLKFIEVLLELDEAHNAKNALKELKEKKLLG